MMKFAAVLFFIFSSLQADVKSDIDVIVQANLELLSPYIDKIAENALLDSDKTMEVSELAARFQAPAPEFSSKVLDLYGSFYTPKEIERIREFHEDETFLKHQLYSMQSQDLMDTIHDTMMEIIEQNGEPKEVPKLHSLVRTVPVEFFDLFVEDSKGYLILDVFAEWCVPCQRMKPVLAELSLLYSGSIRFMQMNKDEARDICKKYKVSFLPTLIFFKDGKEIGRSKGYMGLESAKAKIQEIFGL